MSSCVLAGIETEIGSLIYRMTNRRRFSADSFEVGNNKKALHEAEKVLKKTPNLRCAKALKGLALLRLGKTDESNAIIDKIVAEKPADDSTLQVLSFIYKEIEECKWIHHTLCAYCLPSSKSN